MKVFLSFLLIIAGLNLCAQISFTNNTHELSDTNSISNYFAIGISDMNGDYLDDLIRVGEDSVLKVEAQSVSGLVPLWHTQYVQKAWSMCIADLDRNGKNEVFLGGDSVHKVFSYNDTIVSSYDLDGRYFAQASNIVEIDGDGMVDLFVCNDDSFNYVYTNDGQKLAYNSKIKLGDFSGNYGSVWCDYDNDGDADIYISKCWHNATSYTDPRRVNNFFRNDANGNFIDVAPSLGLDDGAQSWAADFGDIDNDGDFDLVIADHYDPNLLFENNGNGTFTDVTSTANLDTNNYHQVKFADFDNDTYLDLVFATRSVKGHKLFRNNGNGTFGVINSAFPDTNYIIRTYAIGDLNNDGFLDLIVGADFKKDQLYFNVGNTNNYLRIHLLGRQSNVNGIGARIEIFGPWGIQIREVRSGESYGIMNSLTQHFGLGSATEVDSIVTKWPSGKVTRHFNVAANQTFILKEDKYVGLHEPEKNEDLTIYPNPTNGRIEIELNDFSEKVKVIQREVTGKFVKINSYNPKDDVGFQLNGSPGVYIIEVISESKKIVRRVVKQ